MKENSGEYLHGSIERVTYHNTENGFCVIRVNVKGFRDLVTVTGSVPSVNAGEYIKCKGNWYNDKNHGRQFKADFLKTSHPNTLEGIEKYLGSGLIKGIGAHFAKKLVDAFKENVFEVIENDSVLLSSVEGIGKIRASSITKNWQSQKVVREIMVFLTSHGVGTSRATRIYKTYGDNAITIVSDNPYRLAKDIKGIGFVSADSIARNLGIDKNSSIRGVAGLSYVLLEATNDGHCGLPKCLLIEKSCKLLDIEESVILFALEEELGKVNLIKDSLDGVDVIFLSNYYFYEKNSAKILFEIINTKLDVIIDDSIITRIQEKLGIKLAQNQFNAVKSSISNKVNVITGGPGTGKTTLIKVLIGVLADSSLNIKLCAPTGRAAKRLSESAGIEATTIHRLLSVDAMTGKFKHDEKNKLSCDYLIVDEVSMVDAQLFYFLLKALPKSVSLLLVGDVDQLPSVGPGCVLKSIIDSERIPTTRLNEIFRQARTSNIITNAYRVNKGIMIDTKIDREISSDFYFLNATKEDIVSNVTSLVSNRIPKRFGVVAEDIQVLTPMQRGLSGARNLNIELQKVLNPDYEMGITKFGNTFAVNDKVMQIENNYDKEVYNGDVGFIKAIDEQNAEVLVDFDGKDIVYDYTDLDQLTLAYATTIHKSQGSEYRAVIVPLLMESYMMLRRNLLYTGITRGKKLVVVLGEKKAIFMGIKRGNDTDKRFSKLGEWLAIGFDDNV